MPRRNPPLPPPVWITQPHRRIAANGDIPRTRKQTAFAANIGGVVDALSQRGAPNRLTGSLALQALPHRSPRIGRMDRNGRNNCLNPRQAYLATRNHQREPIFFSLALFDPEVVQSGWPARSVELVSICILSGFRPLKHIRSHSAQTPYRVGTKLALGIKISAWDLARWPSRVGDTLALLDSDLCAG